MDIIEKISKFFAEQEQNIEQSLSDAETLMAVPSRPKKNTKSPSTLRRKTIAQGHFSTSTSTTPRNNQEEHVPTRLESRTSVISALSVHRFTDPSTNTNSQQSPMKASGRQSSIGTKISPVIIVEDLSSEEQEEDKDRKPLESDNNEDKEQELEEEEDNDDENHQDFASVKEEQNHSTCTLSIESKEQQQSIKPKKKKKKAKKKVKRMMITPEEKERQVKEAEEKKKKIAIAFAGIQERAKLIQIKRMKEKKQKEIEKEQEQKRIQEVMMKIEEIRRKKKNKPATTTTSNLSSLSNSRPHSAPSSASSSPRELNINLPYNTLRRQDFLQSVEENEEKDLYRPYLAKVEKYMRTRMQLEMEIRERTLRKKTELEKEMALKKKFKQKKTKENNQKKKTIEFLKHQKKNLQEELEKILKEENEIRIERLQLEHEAAANAAIATTTEKKKKKTQQDQDQDQDHGPPLQLSRVKKEEWMMQHIRKEEYKRLMEEEMERTKAAAEARTKAQLRLSLQRSKVSRLRQDEDEATQEVMIPTPSIKERMYQNKKNLHPSQHQNNQIEDATITPQQRIFSWSIRSLTKKEIENVLLYEILSSCSEEEEEKEEKET